MGRDLAVTPGAVDAQDAAAEVLRYALAADTVFARPVLVVPPPIGRFYFLDLQPGRSFVEYATSRGLECRQDQPARRADQQPAPEELGSERRPVLGPAPGFYVRDMVPTR